MTGLTLAEGRNKSLEPFSFSLRFCPVTPELGAPRLNCSAIDLQQIKHLCAMNMWNSLQQDVTKANRIDAFTKELDNFMRVRSIDGY